MPTNAQITQDLTPVQVRQKWAYDQFLTYSALGGLISDDSGRMRRMPIYEFCQYATIDQKTTWTWKHAPGFAEKVRTRRIEVMPLARESMWFNQLHLLGMQLQDKRAAVDALKTLTGHFSDLQLPVQRQDVKVQGGIADLLNVARERRLQETQEGDVIDVSPIDA